MAADSGTPNPGSRADLRGRVRAELDKLRDLARKFSLEEIRQGEWFATLLKFSLDPYAGEVDAAYFDRLYPGLSPDQRIRARIELAARYASIGGGLSAGAYAGAVVATRGSRGATSAVTLPAAGASFVLDLLFTSNLQLRLAHDIAVISGVPLDLEDPEDLWKLIRIAFVIKGGEAGRTLVAKSLPVVGRYLLRRSAVKFAVPAVGVPLSAAVNYWSTRSAGAYARTVFRREGAVVEAARRMTEGTEHPAELLWVLWMVIKADGLVHENERLLLKHVTGLLRSPESELAALTELAVTVNLQRDKVWALLEAADGDLDPLYDAGAVAAAVDGKINVNELAVLRRLAAYAGRALDEGELRARATAYAKGTEPHS